jgi:Flp pilus assembly protein TadD
MNRPVLILCLVLFALLGCSRPAATPSRTLSPFVAQARNAVHAGDGDLEIQALRRRLLESPKDITLRRRLADRFAAAGYPDLALEHLRLAAELQPSDFALQLDLCEALQGQGLTTQAKQILAATLALPSPAAPLLTRAAILSDDLDGPATAEPLHRRALARDPANSDFINNLAYNLMRQNRPLEAESLLRDLLRARPTHERARNNLALLYASQLNQPDEAILHWKAISGPAAAHNNLAAVYIEKEKWTEARAELEKALALRFQFPEALANLRLVAARTGGTVEVNLNQDSKPSGLSKLAKVFRQVFLGDERETQSKNPRSRS